MAIIVVEFEPFLHTWDPRTGTRINRVNLSANDVTPYLAINKRHLMITRLVANSVVPYHPETNTTGTAISIGSNPSGVYFHHRYISKLSSSGTISQIDPVTETIIGTVSLPGGSYSGITGDGDRFLWVLQTSSASVFQLDAETGTLTSSFTVPAEAVDLFHDGRFLWILVGAEGENGSIRQYDPFTGTQVSSFGIGSYGVGEFPISLVGDGRFIYQTERNEV